MSWLGAGRVPGDDGEGRVDVAQREDELDDSDEPAQSTHEGDVRLASGRQQADLARDVLIVGDAILRARQAQARAEHLASVSERLIIASGQMSRRAGQLLRDSGLGGRERRDRRSS